MATQRERMLYHYYMKRHNEVVKCIHMLLCNQYNIIRRNKLRNHSVQETISNKDVTIIVDTRIQTAIKIEACKPDILVIDKKRKEITIIEIGITSQSQLVTVETEKKRKYDILANHLGQLHKMKTKIIPWVMTWDGIVTKMHRQYIKEIKITPKIEAYMQYIVIKKTMESISFDYRRRLEDDTKDQSKELCESVDLQLVAEERKVEQDDLKVVKE